MDQGVCRRQSTGPQGDCPGGGHRPSGDGKSTETIVVVETTSRVASGGPPDPWGSVLRLFRDSERIRESHSVDEAVAVSTAV